jgi:hypothetical protein
VSGCHTRACSKVVAAAQDFAAMDKTVRARLGRLSAVSAFHSKPIL